MDRLEIDVRRPVEVPVDVYWHAHDTLLQLRREEAAAARAFADGAQRVAATHADELGRIVGATNGGLTRYEELRTRQRQELADLRRHAGTSPQAVRASAAERKRIVAASRQALEEIGFDAAAYHAANAQAQRDIAALELKCFGPISHAEVRPRVPNKTFVPPYDGSLAHFSWHKAWNEDSDNLPDPTASFYLDRTLGKMGGDTSISVSDASNYDQASIVSTSELLTWYQMPKAGEVQVRFHGQWVAFREDGHISDEWGVSDVDLKVFTGEYARVISPTTTAKTFWPSLGWEDTNDDDDHSWSTESVTPGFAYASGNVAVAEVFPKDQWVLVALGTEERNSFVSNDVTVSSHIRKRQFIQEIGVSVA